MGDTGERGLEHLFLLQHDFRWTQANREVYHCYLLFLKHCLCQYCERFGLSWL